MRNFIIYTKPNCPYCDRAKNRIERSGDKYKEYVIGEDIARDVFLGMFPNVKTVPQIVCENEHIGGYDNLLEWYSNGNKV